MPDGLSNLAACLVRDKIEADQDVVARLPTTAGSSAVSSFSRSTVLSVVEQVIYFFIQLFVRCRAQDAITS